MIFGKCKWHEASKFTFGTVWPSKWEHYIFCPHLGKQMWWWANKTPCSSAQILLGFSKYTRPINAVIWPTSENTGQNLEKNYTTSQRHCLYINCNELYSNIMKIQTQWKSIWAHWSKHTMMLHIFYIHEVAVICAEVYCNINHATYTMNIKFGDYQGLNMVGINLSYYAPSH